MNTFGEILRLTTFGESHGVAIGGVIDGMPAMVPVDTELIQRELERRRPGQSTVTSSRNESDHVELLSGIYNGVTTGTPIGFIIRNEDQRPTDYEAMKDIFRPSHADYTYHAKYGVRNHRGGGRASARETAARIVAGAIASQALATLGIQITAYTSRIGDVVIPKEYGIYTRELIDANAVRCPDPATADAMIQLIERIKADGDSVGGSVECVISGVGPGLGDPVFGRLNSRLAAAMFSIGAVKGVEIGSGVRSAESRGSELNDPFTTDESGRIITTTNNSGGIQGGISNGMPITLRVSFKPVATIMREQTTVDTQGRSVNFTAKGRHDPCVVPRAVPVVEAMAALTILDSYLINKTARL